MGIYELYFFCELHTTHIPHLNVQQYNLAGCTLKKLQSFLWLSKAVYGCGGFCLFRGGNKSLQRNLLIVYCQYIHAPTSFGIRIVTVVPFPGSL